MVDLYLFCMALGISGLIAMLALGFGHGLHGGHSGHGDLGHGGHAQSVIGDIHHGGGPAHGTHALSPHHGGADHHGGAHGFSGKQAALSLLAPRVWFSLLFGFGVAGCLLHPWLGGLVLTLAALASAVVFERWMVQPVWRFCLGFASNPAKTLESTMLEEAVALTDFDPRGQGLISVKLDGQIRQMLATLQNASGDAARRVHSGDKLIIVGVDPRRNSCTVARTETRPPQLS